MRTFKEGDTVHWTHASKRSQSVTMQRREGEIVEVDDRKAKIRKANGRTIWVALKRLRKPGEKSQVTEFVEAMREAGRKGE